jgi:hypothetical protein
LRPFLILGNGPFICRHLREMFKIDAADYMISLCGDDALRELMSPGKSGSVFYLSHDDRFMIKTMKKSEVQVSKPVVSFISVLVLIMLSDQEPMCCLYSLVSISKINKPILSLSPNLHLWQRIILVTSEI